MQDHDYLLRTGKRDERRKYANAQEISTKLRQLRVDPSSLLKSMKLASGESKLSIVPRLLLCFERGAVVNEVRF